MEFIAGIVFTLLASFFIAVAYHSYERRKRNKARERYIPPASPRKPLP